MADMTNDKRTEELNTAKNLIRRLETWSESRNFMELNRRERTLIAELCNSFMNMEEKP